jgi:hypothetical protein
MLIFCVTDSFWFTKFEVMVLRLIYLLCLGWCTFVLVFSDETRLAECNLGVSCYIVWFGFCYYYVLIHYSHQEGKQM